MIVNLCVETVYGTAKDLSIYLMKKLNLLGRETNKRTRETDSNALIDI